ncbi:hypothetical protein Y1Q_0005055 [Alligator mississippiensis]|uniref:Reverse transcriptase/retrotransposon-derived protein RNase H-like domain-containing protein n=1 Tax=Alligator mississippiensis TaxID=8496 RepID=A0A151MP69_ALLMI|nr:hypothetical protein Y1Q_0005055 [Alligator mississippiensis]
MGISNTEGVKLTYLLELGGGGTSPLTTPRTDASEMAVGAVLCQKQEGIERPIAYASRKLNAAKTRCDDMGKVPTDRPEKSNEDRDGQDINSKIKCYASSIASQEIKNS